MNIEEERKDFEQLPDIKGILQDGYGFNSELNQYFHPDIENHRLGCAYLMGGWMAYQAQSKKLEGCVVVNSESLLFHAQSIRKLNNGDWENVCQEIEEHVCAIEKILEAVRSGNE